MNINKQAGAALPTALLILLIVTILGISSMSSTSLDLKMAKNAEDAMAALHGGERRAEALTNILSIIQDNPNPNDPVLIPTELDSGTGVETGGAFSFVAQTAPPTDKKEFLFAQNASLEQSERVVMNHYNLNITSETGTGARKNLFIGYAIVVPN